VLYVYPLLVLLFAAGVSAGAFFYATRAEYGKHNLQAGDVGRCGEIWAEYGKHNLQAACAACVGE